VQYHSDACLVRAYLGAERTGAFYEGHNVGFEFFGGVPRSIPAGRLGKGNDKGKVEGPVRGSVHEVVIACAADEIERHPRSYEREDFVFNPLHYLALLEQKIGALDQAAPLVGWGLPAEFATLRRLLEARMGKPGSV
jgi:hypothetical protein